MPTVSSTLCFYVCSAAWIDKCRPDLLISESTYATTIRDSKRCRERDFLKKVHESIERGGKVIFRVVVILYFQVFTFLPLSHSGEIRLTNFVFFIFLGSHSSFCSRKGTRTLHPFGNVLVSSSKEVKFT